ncbi:MAG: hypothetical protein WA661_06810, partial [Xanthobacteraceae bacterium]
VHDDPPLDCAAKVIKRETWYDGGALALRRDGAGFVIDSTRPKNFDQPWAPALPQRASDALAASGNTSAPHGSAPRAATPQQHDIEADQ